MTVNLVLAERLVLRDYQARTVRTGQRVLPAKMELTVNLVLLGSLDVMGQTEHQSRVIQASKVYRAYQELQVLLVRPGIPVRIYF